MGIWIKRYLPRKLEKGLFPSLTRELYRIVSWPKWMIWWRLKRYNCIAYAAGDNTRWWWPDPYYLYYWPDGVTREQSVPAFIEMFCSLKSRYNEFDEKLDEPNFEKVAIYFDRIGTPPHTFAGMPTHAARQTINGNWRSKLGRHAIIEHTTLECLNGRYPAYGEPIKILRRERIEKSGFLKVLLNFVVKW
jgi:hypothetical protein